MFLAIINDTYSDIKWEIQQDSVPVGEFVSRKLKSYWNRICPCKISSDRSQVSLSKIKSKVEILTRNDPEASHNNTKQLHNLTQRIDLLEIEVQKIVGLIDNFITNITSSIFNNDEEEDQ